MDTAQQPLLRVRKRVSTAIRGRLVTIRTTRQKSPAELEHAPGCATACAACATYCRSRPHRARRGSAPAARDRGAHPLASSPSPALSRSVGFGPKLATKTTGSTLLGLKVLAAVSLQQAAMGWHTAASAAWRRRKASPSFRYNSQATSRRGCVSVPPPRCRNVSAAAVLVRFRGISLVKNQPQAAQPGLCSLEA